MGEPLIDLGGSPCALGAAVSVKPQHWLPVSSWGCHELFCELNCVKDTVGLEWVQRRAGEASGAQVC